MIRRGNQYTIISNSNSLILNNSKKLQAVLTCPVYRRNALCSEVCENLTIPPLGQDRYLSQRIWSLTSCVMLLFWIFVATNANNVQLEGVVETTRDTYFLIFNII